MDLTLWFITVPTYIAGAGIIWGVVRNVSSPIGRILKLVTVIEAEFRPNGGSTLRDLVQLGAARQTARDDIDSEPGFEADAAGNFIRANRALQRLAQRGSDGFLGAEWEHIVAEPDRDRVWDAWCDAVQRGRTFESAFDIIAVDGTRYQIDCIATPIRDGKSVTGWLGKYRHVAEQQDSRRRRRA